MGQGEQTVRVDGHRLRLTNLDKVLYPETGTTKGEVVAYYADVAEQLLPHVRDRPVTRKRWVHGVGTDDEPGEVFFQKHLDAGTPYWVARRPIEHSDRTSEYPLANDLATLTWLAQIASLELHVPQWRFGSRGARLLPDRLVLDLDPGDGAGLAECVEVAHLARDILDDVGLEAMPVTSGSKGIHLYAALDGTRTSDEISRFAHELARAIEADHPGLAVSDMRKSLRTGRVLVDWSQNNGSKTTIAPYSLRGRSRPTVAAPRTWRELASPELRQLEAHEVVQRVRRRGDPLAGVAERSSAVRLGAYRAKRSPGVTPEPFGDDAHRARADRGPDADPIFVIQRHEASSLHYDVRLERDGVLVSWAVPKGPPEDAGQNRLAVQTEDHPMDYAAFEGDIPRGEYGAGRIEIWDAGTYELEKWREGAEVIATLHGRRGSHRYALIRTRDEDWLMHLMQDQQGAEAGVAVAPSSAPSPSPVSETQESAGSRTAAGRSARAEPGTAPEFPTGAGAGAESVSPMLATAGDEFSIRERDGWRFEGKWDGVRAIATVRGGRVELRSRNGLDLTPAFPELQSLADALDGDGIVDGEIVALEGGRPDFGTLQRRLGLTAPRDVDRARRAVPAHLFAFDLLEHDGGRLLELPYARRRAALAEAVTPSADVQVPPELGDDLDAALATSRELALEGVVAKLATSTYRAGRRSRDWLKLKHLLTHEVVVVGWRPGRGRRSGGVGSLLVAIPDDGGLRYAGRVGTGFRDRDLDAMLPRLERLARRSPAAIGVPALDARDAEWVAPELVAEVEYAGRTREGRLRHPTWRGWRPDKSPGDVRPE